jgi:hypothetical protein
VSEILFLHLDDIPPENVSHLVPYTLTGQGNIQSWVQEVYDDNTMHVAFVQIIYIYVCVCVCVCTYKAYVLFRESINDFLIKNKVVECIKIH